MGMELASSATPDVLNAQSWRPQRSSRVWAVVIVVAAHAALLLFMHLEHSRRLPIASADDSLTVILVPVPITRPLPLPQPVEPPLSRPAHQEPTAQSRTETEAPASPLASQHAPAIDWRAEIGRVAREAAENASKEQLNLPCKAPRKFGDPPQTGCRPQPKPFEWDPEPGLFGFAGGLPFARVGKRCAIGLGFFGCGIGELPKPNGKLFESMDDPDRPRSSVPDSNPGQ
jgi:hypothetical protein